MASPNKSKMAAAAIFNFGKMSITPHWIKITVPNFMERCITAMRRQPHNQKSNRTLIRVTSSNERLKHKCVDLSDQCRYFNPIWHRTQISHCQHTRMAKFSSHNLKIQDGGSRHLEFRKNINNSRLDKDIGTICYVKMHHGHETGS